MLGCESKHLFVLSKGKTLLKNSECNHFSNCQALVPNPSPPPPQSPQTQSQPSQTQLKTQINPKGTGADTNIL